MFERFENNLNTILSLLQSGLNIRTTPYHDAIPLEVGLLCEVLNRAGTSFAIRQEGLGSLEEFREQYMQQKSTASNAMHRILEDKRSYMRSPGGATVLLKEMLIRRLEFFNEIARAVEIIKNQQVLGSPKQFTYQPLLNAKE